MTLGQTGENLAADFLEQNGYRILLRNFRTKIGEIDIIANIEGTLVFCEVKTRRNYSYGHPIEAVTPKKQMTIRKLAEYYLATNNFGDYSEMRFDVIAILSDGVDFTLNHYINAF